MSRLIFIALIGITSVFFMLGCSGSKVSIDVQIERLSKELAKASDDDSIKIMQKMQSKFSIVDTIYKTNTVYIVDTLYQEMETEDTRWRNFLVGTWLDLRKTNRFEGVRFTANGTIDYFRDEESISNPAKYGMSSDGVVRFTWDVYARYLVMDVYMSDRGITKETKIFSKLRYINQSTISMCEIDDIRDFESVAKFFEDDCVVYTRQKRNE